MVMFDEKGRDHFFLLDKNQVAMNTLNYEFFDVLDEFRMSVAWELTSFGQQI